MLNSLSSNVVLAKARTMYGRRLKQADYNDLMKCRTVGEVAGYLKSHTAYNQALAGVMENQIHRGELEARLKQKLVGDYASLCKYEVEVDRHFSRFFIQHEEIEFVLHTILSVNAGVRKERSYPQFSYLSHESRLDFKVLSRVRTYAELLRALEGTPYRKLLEPFSPKDGKLVDYAGAEHALYFNLYSGILDIIRSHFFGGTRKQLFTIFNAYMDLHNYVRIIRLKTNYGCGPQTIRKLLLPSGALSRKTMEEMVSADSEQGVQAALERTDIGRKAFKLEGSYLSEIPMRMNYEICCHYIDFSTHPTVVLISYIFLCEAEMKDIITIVEGIRYQLSPGEIRKLLISAGAQIQE